ncbi:MAG: hypothetical protein JEZ06_06900 [Anaerolineaceae bacterium]|nr:hypothetical protein [Anaerolineaceae bacterium]
MLKRIKLFGISTLMVLTITIALVAFTPVDTVYASALDRRGPPTDRPATGTGVPLEQNINLEGQLSDDMAAYYADALGIPVETLKAVEDAGQTLYEIGTEYGFSTEQIAQMQADARSNALDLSVANGTITEEQAEWLKSRGNTGGYGLNLCTSEAGTCEYPNQTYNQGSARGGRGR